MMLSKTWPTRLIQVLIEERRTGGPEESYIGAAMRDGICREPPARAAYMNHRQVVVDEVGFIQHP